MKELVKEGIYKDFTAALEIFHDQNRILKEPHYPSILSSPPLRHAIDYFNKGLSKFISDS